MFFKLSIEVTRGKITETEFAVNFSGKEFQDIKLEEIRRSSGTVQQFVRGVFYISNGTLREFF